METMAEVLVHRPEGPGHSRGPLDPGRAGLHHAAPGNSATHARAELDAATRAGIRLLQHRVGHDAHSLALRNTASTRPSSSRERASEGERRADGAPAGTGPLCPTFPPPERIPSDADKVDRLKTLFHAYNQAGITAVADRKTDADVTSRYQRMAEHGDLTVRPAPLAVRPGHRPAGIQP